MSEKFNSSREEFITIEDSKQYVPRETDGKVVLEKVDLGLDEDDIIKINNRNQEDECEETESVENKKEKENSKEVRFKKKSAVRTDTRRGIREWYLQSDINAEKIEGQNLAGWQRYKSTSEEPVKVYKNGNWGTIVKGSHFGAKISDERKKLK